MVGISIEEGLKAAEEIFAATVGEDPADEEEIEVWKETVPILGVMDLADGGHLRETGPTSENLTTEMVPILETALHLSEEAAQNVVWISEIGNSVLEVWTVDQMDHQEVVVIGIEEILVANVGHLDETVVTIVSVDVQVVSETIQASEVTETSVATEDLRQFGRNKKNLRIPTQFL